MASPLKIYDAFHGDQDKAHALIEYIDERENEKKFVSEASLLRETSEIRAQLTKETTEINARISKESAEINARISKESAEINARISKETAEIRLEIEKVRTEAEKNKSDLFKHINRQTFLTLGTMTFLLAALKALDYFLKY